MNFQSILLSWLVGSFVLALGLPTVVINEIAWMGTSVSPNDEWIELYNQSDLPLDLEGWQLRAIDGTPTIKLAGIIPARGFYLLERTNDESASEASADQIYQGALNNSGEQLQLFDKQGNLVDEADALKGWPAGDNESKQTIERNNKGWQSSTSPAGTPKKPNSQGALIIAAQSDNPLAKEKIETKTPANELIKNLPSPKSPSEVLVKDQNLSAGLDIETFDKFKASDRRSFGTALAAGLFSLLSGLAILLLKKKLTKKNEKKTRPGLFNER